MRLEHGESPEGYPRVYTQGSCYEPQNISKKEYGVVMIDGTDKKTIPWHKVESVCERIPEQDTFGESLTGGK